VRSKGVELELDTRLSSGIPGHPAFGAAKARDAGGRIANSPNFLLNASFSLPVLWPRLRLAPQILFVGDRLDVAGDQVDSSVQLNVTFTAKLGNRLVASATVYNLADADVFVPARPEH
jgi:outer membrane receptor protein involved in Fe transport